MSVVELPQRIGMVELASRGSRILIWSYFATMLVLAIWTIGDVRSPYPTAAAVLAFFSVAVIFSRDRGKRLSLPSTIVVMGLALTSNAAVIWQLKYDFGYSSWTIGACGTALFFMALRGRIAFAWMGFALLSVVMAVWGLTTDHGLALALLQTARQVAVLIVGTLFATGMKRAGEEVERLSDEATARAVSESQQLAIEEERKQRLLALGEFVTPLLTRLASGATITAKERLDFALAEAELRDGLRARALQLPVIAQAARAARRRGVEVVLLDDSDSSQLDPQDLSRAASRIAELLDDAHDGRVTARLLPAGRDAIATIVLDGAEHRSESVTATR